MSQINQSKILVVSPAWIGDTVMTQSLFKILKQQQPDCVIDVLSPKGCADVLKRMPEVNDIIISPFGHGDFKLKERMALGKSLRDKKYDQAIVTPNSFKSAFIPFFANIPKRTGWRGEWRYGLLNDVRVLDEQKYPLMVERLIALGLEKDAPLPSEKIWPSFKVTEEQIRETNSALNVNVGGAKILALCPGAAFGPAKRWPTKYFADVANKKIAEGWQVWIFGGPSDADISNEIQTMTNNKCVEFTAKTSVLQAVDLLAQATTVLTNDTGLMHIAAALGREVVVLYGSSSPKFTPPLSERVKILWLEIECSPCFKRECPLGHFRCMNDLLPEKVIAAL